MLLIVTAIKLVAEIALLALLGRWVLGLLAGAGKESNLFYQLLDIVARPFVKAVRWITPAVVIDRHMPLAAFTLLTMIWLIVTLLRISMCLEIGVQACR